MKNIKQEVSVTAPKVKISHNTNKARELFDKRFSNEKEKQQKDKEQK